LPERVRHVVDLGAGTGALTRLLVDRADEVTGVEPDDRMRAVLAEQVPRARAVEGRGESIPVADGTADAVLASSSWHWMEVEPALRAVGRVLRSGGVLGVVWSGPDRDGPFVAQARALLAQPSTDRDASSLLVDADRPTPTLEIPPGVGFAPPEHRAFTWDVAL